MNSNPQCKMAKGLVVYVEGRGGVAFLFKWVYNWLGILVRLVTPELHVEEGVGGVGGGERSHRPQP